MICVRVFSPGETQHAAIELPDRLGIVIGEGGHRAGALAHRSKSTGTRIHGDHVGAGAADLLLDRRARRCRSPP